MRDDKDFTIPLEITIILFFMAIYMERIYPVRICYIHQYLIAITMIYFCVIAIIDIIRKRKIGWAITASIIYFIVMTIVLLYTRCIYDWIFYIIGIIIAIKVTLMKTRNRRK